MTPPAEPATPPTVGAGIQPGAGVVPPKNRPLLGPFGTHRVRVKYMNIRECADTFTFNTRLSLQDNLNELVATKLNQISNLHRVISMNYTESEGLLRRNCALCTVWYEVLEPVRSSTPNDGSVAADMATAAAAQAASQR
ncbi:hypothetical protein H696_04903 [Fonticula alba]|uniref:Uncharacterized protein n=1 Tax=Fonticula alba TaxID=691883 RepID=A0A058Z2X8_FONAL|nr:hypothetical protein H696_04903 [Fonticula alba]KCV68610.1 hypothetical protein H696_04903 [Fonticula alba]|eukprot:XP_009497042.1 hypothetical protein H696_04903 [Fonticula alba]